ncbi:MAG TPA: F420-nonreducing hydrogenase [Thermoguttaceae bacterium]|nr:F420-nonreducing hydrogenase [Thermoguttaceae bacterium]
MNPTPSTPTPSTASSASGKPKLALYWAASCGGCEIAVLAINEKILDVAAAFDIVFWPCVMDGKVRDIERMPDGGIDVCLFNGGIRTSEQEYMAQLLRRKSKVLVAFGSCAHEGCIPGLANLSSREEIFQAVYGNGQSTENPQELRPQVQTHTPEGEILLPYFYDTLRTLDQTVPVDYYLPGCPPEAENIWKAIEAIVSGKLPPRGTVLGPTTTVCDECPRKRSEKKIQQFKRTWQTVPDEETCLLEQGLVCCGIATRAGCGALCPRVNSPCIGCHGPNVDVPDFGARMMTALSSVLDANTPEEIERILTEGIPDPVGVFYRFSLAASLLRRSRLRKKEVGPGGNGGNGANQPTGSPAVEKASAARR